jgi:Ser/Thr protein kinase RdoA (MazF antagonist)
LKQDVIPDVLSSFGLIADRFSIQRTGSGYINDTYKLAGDESFILQRINTNVFRKPGVIADNIRLAAEHLRRTHPDYLFPAPIPTTSGAGMSYDPDGRPWRLFRYLKNTVTIDRVGSEQEAFSASAAFARLTHYLEGIDVGLFKPTIERFHDLSWRYGQFQEAEMHAREHRRQQAAEVVHLCHRFAFLVERYNTLIEQGALRSRVTHNDTKINNILLDGTTHQPVGVIDLDTLMPGYFIYDVGDMIRTFVSPVSEEEKDLDAVHFRKPVYDAVVAGYLSEMGDDLTEKEKKLFPFAGMMMTYIMALRALADFLAGDIYYQITYPEQNLVRAKNQLRFLQESVRVFGEDF